LTGRAPVSGVVPRKRASASTNAQVRTQDLRRSPLPRS
jgi:hypothetical protein